MAYSTIALAGLGRIEECFKEIERFFRFFPDRDSPTYIAIALGTIAVYEMTGQYVKYILHLEHAKEALQNAKSKFQEADSKYYLDKADKLEALLKA